MKLIGSEFHDVSDNMELWGVETNNKCTSKTDSFNKICLYSIAQRVHTLYIDTKFIGPRIQSKAKCNIQRRHWWQRRYIEHLIFEKPPQYQDKTKKNWHHNGRTLFFNSYSYSYNWH